MRGGGAMKRKRRPAVLGVEKTMPPAAGAGAGQPHLADAEQPRPTLKFGDEEGRLLALRRLNILDSGPEEPFEKIVKLVEQVLRVPICAVSLVDAGRQWFKARCGLDMPQTGREISFCSHAIEQAAPLVIPDALADSRFRDNPLVTGELGVRFYAGVQLRTADGYAIGSLCAIDTVPRVFSDVEMAILESFARVVMDEVELRQIAATDHLTGARSRRAWTERADMEINRSQRYGRTVSLVIMDIDHFKQVNDVHGHSAGDAVIKHLACLCMGNIRPSDLFARYGGEEFVLLMPETCAADALFAAERIRKLFGTTRPVGGGSVGCTISMGVAELVAGDVDLDALIARADEALYEAKEQGRDRCVVSRRNLAGAVLTAA